MFPMGGCLTFIQKERSEYQILRNNNKKKKKKKRKRWKGKETKKNLILFYLEDEDWYKSIQIVKSFKI